MACLYRHGQSEQMQLLSLKGEAHRDTQYLQWGAHKMGAHDLVCLKWKRTDQYVSGYIQTRFFAVFKTNSIQRPKGSQWVGIVYQCKRLTQPIQTDRWTDRWSEW